jgi:PAS domain S-box-containing protein
MDAKQRRSNAGRGGPLRRYVPAVCVLAAGVLASAVAFVAVRNWERKRIVLSFGGEVEERAATMRVSIARHLETLCFMREFYAGSKEVERGEFDDFLAPTLAAHAGYQAVEWAPRVPAADRAAYEDGVRAAGFPDFRVHPLTERDELFPVDFVFPYAGNEGAQGYDLASDPEVRKTLEQARDSGEMAATAPIRQSQAGDGQATIWVCVPIYRNGVPHATIEQRREHLTGFVVGILRVRELVGSALEGLDTARIQFCVEDVTDPGRSEVVYRYQGAIESTAAASAGGQGPRVCERGALCAEETLAVAGRRWVMKCRPALGCAAFVETWVPYGILSGSLLCTLLLAGYLGSLAIRSARIDRLVRQQSVVNALLRIGLEDIPLEEMLERCLDEVLSNTWLFLAPRGAIFLVEDEPRVLVLKAQRNLAEPLRTTCARVPFGRCLCGRAAASGRIEFAAAVDERHEIAYPDMQPHGHYCVPIRAADGVSGLLVAYVEAEHRRSEVEEDFLESVANTIAGVIQRRRVEARLRESEERHRAITETAQDAIITVDCEGRIRLWNSAAAKIFGYAAAEAVGRCVMDIIVPPKYHEAKRKGFAEFVRTGQGPVIGKTREVTALRKDGAEFPVELSVSAYLDRDAQVAIALIRDITERKQGERAVARLASFPELNPNPIVELDATGHVQYCNPAAQRLFPELPTLGRAHPYLAAPADSPSAPNRESPQPFTREVRVDGTWYQQVWSYVPEIECVRVYAMDITERKRAEQELARYAEQLEEAYAALQAAHGEAQAARQRAEQAKDALAAAQQELVDASRRAGMAEIATGVLHNVGNVLNSINVSTGLIGDKLRESMISGLDKAVALMQAHADDLGTFLAQDEKGKRLPDFLAALAEHLARERTALLQELQALTDNVDHVKNIVRVQQSYAGVSGAIETVALADVVEDAVRLNEAALGRHPIEVVREYAAVPPVSLEKHKLLQILVNLVRNAGYALRECERADRRLVLRIGMSAGDRVQVQVNDNGVGIPRENLARIFAHGFTTRKDGHGFGLHSSALAAKALGGALTAHSDGPGAGATFTLELPVLAVPATR